jgi:hypothetical protein
MPDDDDEDMGVGSAPRLTGQKRRRRQEEEDEDEDADTGYDADTEDNAEQRTAPQPQKRRRFGPDIEPVFRYLVELANEMHVPVEKIPDIDTRVDILHEHYGTPPSDSGDADPTMDIAEDPSLPDDFLADITPTVPYEILATIEGRRLELGAYDFRPRPAATPVVTPDTNGTADDFATARAAQEALSVVFAYVHEAPGRRNAKKKSTKAPVDRFSKDARVAPTFYGTTQMGRSAPGLQEPVATPQLDRIGDLDAYLDSDEVSNPLVGPDAYDRTSNDLRRDGAQGPHTVALVFTDTAFTERLKHETAGAIEAMQARGDAGDDEEIAHAVAQWSVLEEMLATLVMLPREVLREVEANISLSRQVPDKSQPGGARAEPVDHEQIIAFADKIEATMARVTELFAQIDTAIQAGKALALQARNGGWNATDIAAWKQMDAAKFATAHRLLFEYKNMEPCATYVWNEWRDATKAEIKGKGERSPADYVAAVLAAGQIGSAEDAAKKKWEALLDLADHGSKLIDGTGSRLDGATLWDHIERELTMVDPDSADLLAELVQLAGLFPSFAIQPSKYGPAKDGARGKLPSDQQDQYNAMKKVEADVRGGTIDKATLTRLLQDMTDSGAFTPYQVQDALRSRTSEPPSPEAETEKFDQRLRLLAELLKRRRARM